MLQEALNRFSTLFTPPGQLLGRGKSLCIPSLTGAADAFLALHLTDKDALVLAITPGLPDADRLYDDLQLIASNERILEFPPLLPNDKASLGTRLKTIAALRAWQMKPYPCIIVAPFPALASPLSLGSTTELPSIQLKALKFAELCEKLAKFGYNRVPQVESEGDYSVRGGIVDAWGPGETYPFRSEFFGDDLESLRTFNPATQISIERIDNAELLPVNLNDQPLTKTVKERYFCDLLPDSVKILALEHNSYTLDDGVCPQLKSAERTPPFILYTGDPAPAGVSTYNFQTVPLPGFAELGADEAHHPELFDAARQRLEQHLTAASKRKDTILKLDDLSGGFEIASPRGLSPASPRGLSPENRGLSPGLIVVSKADRVFAKKKTRSGINAAVQSGPRLNDFDDLEPGEYVVHIDYGVGKYLGSTEIVMDGKRSEVFTIEYADGGKLHVPAAHAHLLSRYVGVKGEGVRLHRLDGKRWEKDKKEAQKAVSDIAAALLETQARRAIVPGFAYQTDCEGLEGFEAAFPYEETPDQSAAITAIKQDLGATKPMDRLICGDAGYGKTEVAMRAAFIAAMNGKQVAVLAPTTVLAEQHFETFTSRFDGTPIRIESVSRFQSGGTHQGTFKRLATGACDIVIGTHALLTSKIAFRDLGLIIIDEEQRFGVRHKEFLKSLRSTADVLTLSATPIPRTLYLSMTGARDLSLLRTPPRERVAVETKIVRDSDEIIRSAIQNELERGGQVFFLHNRVHSIGKVEKRLNDLFKKGVNSTLHLHLNPTPEAPRIVVAHGQMDSRTLANKMRDFERGKYDILLSTTIIESGIDIPRANTIIVDQADTFGMADLYQLRGRVGRSARQGVAYFLLPPSGLIDSDARERLAALQRHGGLGSGFNLAVRDLELRGAGNLLGSQQSGHIAAVGFSLYCQLLQRTIALMKGEKVRDVIDVKLNLDFVNPRLPFEYIEEDVQRMSLMKRFAEAQDVRIVRALADEMKDRFGPLPDEAREYVRIAELRVACAIAGITNVDVKGSRAVFYRNGSRDIHKVETLRGKTAERKIAELFKAID